MSNATRPAVIEFRGSDRTPNSLLVFGAPSPSGAITVAELRRLVAPLVTSSCGLCLGAGHVQEREGEYVPAARGETCPCCLDRGVQAAIAEIVADGRTVQP